MNPLNISLGKSGFLVPLRPLSNQLSRITITYRSPAELTFPQNSPRVHTPRQIKQICRSISAFGFLIPIVIDEATPASVTLSSVRAVQQ